MVSNLPAVSKPLRFTMALHQSVTLHTTLGDIKLELACNLVPRMCEVRMCQYFMAKMGALNVAPPCRIFSPCVLQGLMTAPNFTGSF